MCLLLFAWKKHPHHDLVLAANRDEFHQRPTLQANVWEAHPNLIGGKDEVAGGTWIGITKTGKFAALTNYRDPKNIDPKAPSRGQLTLDYLTSELSPKAYLERLKSEKKSFNGFNLLIGDSDSLYYYNNINYNIQKLAPGFYGLSNALLNDPWPKVTIGKANLAIQLSNNQSAEINSNSLFLLLENNKKASDDQLPSTGVSLEWERMLSPLFISSKAYGTRCSTVIYKSGTHFQFIEKTHSTPNQTEKIVQYKN